MCRLMKRLFRERRRLVIVAMATFLGGYVAYFNRSSFVFGLPFSIVAGLAFMIGLTVFLMTIVILFPKIRHVAESVALTIPILSLMGVFGNASDGGFSATTNVLGIMLSSLVVSVYGGAWMDRYLPCRPKKLRSSATSKLKPKELWPYLTVTPDTFTEYATENTISMEWIDMGIRFREIVRSGELAKVEEINTIEVNEPYQRYRFSFEVPDATEAAPVSCGSREQLLSPKGRGTKLETIREFDRVSIRSQLFTWIDDGWGRLDDEIIQHAETTRSS